MVTFKQKKELSGFICLPNCCYYEIICSFSVLLIQYKVTMNMDPGLELEWYQDYNFYTDTVMVPQYQC